MLTGYRFLFLALPLFLLAAHIVAPVRRAPQRPRPGAVGIAG
jgi:hypothetical protein